MKEVVAFTDGSCIGNPGKGGWGVVLLKGGKIYEYGGASKHTTNNIMELKSALEALKLVRGEPSVTIYTDSEYLKNGITRWIYSWKARGWKKKDGGDVKNLELWKEIYALNGPHIKWKWIKGHSYHRYNNRADEIARSFAVGKPVNLRQGEPVEEDTGGDVNIPQFEVEGEKVYLSLVNGVLMVHSNWQECSKRVLGVKGAKYKRCNNIGEQISTLQRWGFSKDEISSFLSNQKALARV